MSRLVACLIGLLGALLVVSIAAADEGYVTWYGPGFQGNVTASGETYDMNGLTAASNRLPFNTWVRVSNPRTGKSVTVRINDRGGFTHALDLSRAAYFALDPPNPWGFWVVYEVVPGPDAPPPAPRAAETSRGGARPPPDPAPAPAQSDYVVAPGDTLFGIARRLGSSVASLLDVNDIPNPDSLAIGQRLRLKAGPAAAPAPTPAPPPPTPTPAKGYVVQPGDTLRSIAASQDVDLIALIRANNLDNPNLLRPGQEIRLPG